MPVASSGKIYFDQLSRSITIDAPPARIVSLVPSQTELLFHLGLDKEIVGITKFCVHPADLCRKKIIVGGTRQINIDAVRQLRPDLIIGNKEENDEAQIRQLAGEFAVWISDIKSLQDACAMIIRIGEITAKADAADQLCQEIKTSFENITPLLPKVSAAYLIWRNPYMAAGSDTFINSMLQAFGFVNVYGFQARYPETSITELKSLNPACILLSSEPFPFREKHVDEIKQSLPDTRILMVDGEMFSWYGSRLLKTAPYFSHIRNQL